ncbi:hypothetical protein E3U43_022112 [Larimichthys crocea]|uniref:Uncharacterized protein n=1 Tax=Larimichthys crocea TaxID=215358 RepID=A0ACD3R8C1_LARCR|nr:hypothetical protein E3U43_022112 [Larimichthys crocea]
MEMKSRAESVSKLRAEQETGGYTDLRCLHARGILKDFLLHERPRALRRSHAHAGPSEHTLSSVTTYSEQ